MAPLLSVRDLTITRPPPSSTPILSSVSLDLSPGEILIVRGSSGSGKSTLLKCIAELNIYQSGTITLHGTTAREMEGGVPGWRVRVGYVPQRSSLLPGTPQDFLRTIKEFKARKQSKGDGEGEGKEPMDLAQEWGIEKVLWTREWSTLSGGEAQRIALAIAVGIGGAEVLLLDEPTSALDEETMKKVEKSLVEMLPRREGQSSNSSSPRYGTGPKALIWITHSPEQADRVGTRSIDITRE
ncbi:hypothetical protein CI109_106955 [Kwoniella shandongensis]|uniref:Uncharacterized protein n=1 Tax=Kwoniella shandongensis TaxID=1734106 RepID=A0A5M6C6F6_9TREE|nr:uncharacterized protein CI109_000791 [Kwoniella shandongensis]KAA5530613.1 hypothetical protein CI109_000791 [Kwoniella shandongensis]